MEWQQQDEGYCEYISGQDFQRILGDSKKYTCHIESHFSFLGVLLLIYLLKFFFFACVLGRVDADASDSLGYDTICN